MPALDGIAVLDLTELIAGPYCSKLLGGLGAEVIKVERAGRGDPSRQIGPFPDGQDHPEKSALFLYLNTNKKSITLNLNEQEGRDIIKDLIKGTDVFIEDFKPGFLSGLELGYNDLREINPGLVMASITDFGQTGPYREYRGGRLAVNALSGYMYINGDPDREPLAGGGEQPAYQGGLHAFTGIMAALLSRETTGEGQYIDVSIMECMASVHQFTVNRYTYSGKVQKRVGNRYIWAHPITIYACRDGYVSIAPSTEDQTEALLTLMDMRHLLEDPRFTNGLERLAHADEFDELVRPWFLERTRKEIVETCQEWRVPAAYVNDVSDLLDEEQYRARDFWVELDHPEAGRLPYAGPAFKMSETPLDYTRAPLLGEHNEEIFIRRLGLSPEYLADLKTRGVV